MAFSDADGDFIMLETGIARRNSYGGIYRASVMGRKPEKGDLNLPNTRPQGLMALTKCFLILFCSGRSIPLEDKI